MGKGSRLAVSVKVFCQQVKSEAGVQVKRAIIIKVAYNINSAVQNINSQDKIEPLTSGGKLNNLIANVVLGFMGWLGVHGLDLFYLGLHGFLLLMKGT